MAVDTFTMLMNGPKPELNSGTLPNGRKAIGYVVWEIPKTGEVLMSFKGTMFSNDAPVFEIVLGSK